MLAEAISLELVALHEAGHAVAHIRLNIPQLRATIVEGGDTLGSVRSQCDVSSHDQARDMAIAYCAGYAALLASGRGETEASAGCGNDFEHAQDLAKAWGLNGGLAHAKDAAIALMRAPENVSATARVAQELLSFRVLDDDVIDVLVELSDGNCSEDDFKRFMMARRSAPLEG